MKAILLLLIWLLCSPLSFTWDCGDNFLCCPAREDYYVENATCVNGQATSCTYVPCPPNLICIPTTLGCIWVPEDFFQ